MLARTDATRPSVLLVYAATVKISFFQSPCDSEIGGSARACNDHISIEAKWTMLGLCTETCQPITLRQSQAKINRFTFTACTVTVVSKMRTKVRGSEADWERLLTKPGRTHDGVISMATGTALNSTTCDFFYKNCGSPWPCENVFSSLNI